MKIFYMFSALLLSWSMDMTDPLMQSRLFFAFLCAQGLVVLVGIYIGIQIWRRGDETLVKVANQTTKQTETKKTWEYDTTKLCELLFLKVGISAGVSYFLASYYSMYFSLIMQAIYNPIMVYNSELFQLHVLGKEAAASLARPWSEVASVPRWLSDIWSYSKEQTDQILVKENSTKSGLKASKNK